jgi:lipopolysaccharide export system protein LptA
MGLNPRSVRYLRSFVANSLWVAFLLLATGAQGQGLGPLKGFRVDLAHFPPPHGEQVKTRLQAEVAVPLPNNNVLLTNWTLQNFRETGENDLVIRGPHCLYDASRTNASSAGPLRVETGDGKFSIEGDGFSWAQPNSTLFISNHVHTVVQPELLEAPGATNAARAVEASGPSPGKEVKPGIDILSEQFEYDGSSGLGSYLGNVRVAGTNLALASGKLILKVPANEPQHPSGLEQITAEQDVVIDYEMGSEAEPVHATCDRAVYATQTGLLDLTGHPVWRAGQRQGRGDELVIDRTNKIFTATRQAWLKMPGQTLGGAGLLSGLSTNVPASEPGTNQLVEIYCDSYEIRTNQAVFREAVRASELVAEQVRSRLNCELMTVTFAGSNQLERLVMETNVMIEQEDKKLSGDRGVFIGTNQLLELTGHPTWQAGLRSGKGTLVEVRGHENEFFVNGNASMRLPAAELAEMETPGSTVKPKPVAAPTVTNEFAEIFCETYTVSTNQARYRGGVYVSHPRMNLACEQMTAYLTPAGDVSRKLLAEQAVAFDLRDDVGENSLHGTGDKAVYTYSVANLVTNDVLRLTGTPAVLQTTNGTVRNDLVILDHTSHKIIAPGDYRIHIKSTGTNTFIMPNMQPGK